MTVTKSYLLGVLHDATLHKNTYRIAQKNKAFIQFLVAGIKALGHSAWMYKEGKDRTIYIAEFSASILRGHTIQSREDKVEYVRGYFDAEGGIAKHKKVRYYLYFAQRDYQDIVELKTFLTQLGIRSGKIHNPSKSIDPNYWRFYISKASYGDFASIVGSYHPEKSRFLKLKI